MKGRCEVCSLCVCVCERVREREKERDRHGKREKRDETKVINREWIEPREGRRSKNSQF